MKFIAADLCDAFLVIPEPAQDSRGFFERTYCKREFAAHGINEHFVQNSRSFSVQRGTLRGMHFQTGEHVEAKVVGCAKGGILDVIIDLRPESKTFRRWQAFELTGENRHQVYVPRGFAHGFQTLEDNSEINYLISNFYRPEAASGVRYDDPVFAIKWPLPISVLSDKDRNWPLIVS